MALIETFAWIILVGICFIFAPFMTIGIIFIGAGWKIPGLIFIILGVFNMIFKFDKRWH